MLGDEEVLRVAAKEKGVLVHDVSDEYHENDDGSNDDDSNRPHLDLRELGILMITSWMLILGRI